MRHWTERARRQKWRRRRSAAWLTIRDGVSRARMGGQTLGRLALRVLWLLIATLGALTLINLFAAWLGGHVHWGSLFEPVSSDSYGGFVAAVVTALAAFLALFFTTVGVIASTAYARVPGAIRRLFVREQTSNIYVWSVAIALVFGIALLALPVVSSFKFRGLTVAVFALLALFSVLSLVILGRDLFNFFDPSMLSRRLYPEFMRAVRSASASGKRVPDDVEARAAHVRAATVLRRYEELVTLITSSDVVDTTAPEAMVRQLLICWRANAILKSTIPTRSEWFGHIASHPNWLTMDHTQLSTALQTRTGVRPTMIPDALWVERRVSSLVSVLLSALATADDWTRTVVVLDLINELIFELATRMQLDEAFALAKMVGEFSHAQLAAERGGRDGDTLRLAIAERQILGFTSLWLGLVRPFENLDPETVSSALDKAVERPRAPYASGSPREVLALLEDIAEGLAFESEIEGERITPRWWVHHMAGRVFVRELQDGINKFVAEVESTLVEPLVGDAAADPELEAVRIFDLLELTHKIGFHLQTVHAAVGSLAALRHDPTGDELWPEVSLPDATPARLEERLLARLGSVALELPSTPHEPTAPDLFGQAYRRLFDGTFHAILDGRDEVARALFPKTIALADRAWVRLREDLSEQRQRELLIFGTEPLVDMMELSGYALLMSRVTGAGIWTDVEGVWESIFSGREASELGGLLIAVLSTQENVFALTPGGVGRSGRQIELTRALRDRGIQETERIWGEVGEEPHADPVVATFAPDDLMGIHHSLADLFVVEYLTHRPDLADLQLSRGVEMLRESIDHRRQQTAGEGSGGE